MDVTTTELYKINEVGSDCRGLGMSQWTNSQFRINDKEENSNLETVLNCNGKGGGICLIL